MYFDSETESPASSPRPDRSYRKTGDRRPRRTTAVVVVALAVIVTVSAGIIAKRYIDAGGSGAKPQAALMAAPKSGKLTFAATFTSDVLNTKVWDTCYPWELGPAGCTNFGNSDEREWYLGSQVRVSGGALNLVAQRKQTAGVSHAGAPEEYSCRSGMVTTFHSYKFEYGMVQIVTKIPFGNGLWPALWLAPTNEQWPPEIDILEHFGNNVQGAVYLHPKTGVRQGGEKDMPHLSAGWHTFTLNWTKSQLTWYYDGTVVFSTTTGVPQQAMYLLMDLADNSAGAGSCSGTMAIKSVKVWQA